MPTLNYISLSPQSQIVRRARIHLVVWTILFFFIGFILVSGGIIALFIIAREDLARGIRILELILPLAFNFAIPAGLACLSAQAGFCCLRAQKRLDGLGSPHLKAAITLFTTLSAGCLGVSLTVAIHFLPPLFSANRELSPYFWIGTPFGGVCLLAAVLAFWTRRTLSRA
jgi:hypothetical protein